MDVEKRVKQSKEPIVHPWGSFVPLQEIYIIIYLRGFADLETPTRLCAIHRASLVAPRVKKKKKSACNAGDPGSIPGLVSSPGEGNGNPLQYSCLENSMDRRAWPVTVHGIAKSWK